MSVFTLKMLKLDFGDKAFFFLFKNEQFILVGKRIEEERGKEMRVSFIYSHVTLKVGSINVVFET